MSNMSDRKPYLIRAIYDWICDNDLTPHLLLENPSQSGAVSGVPEEFCSQEQLVLNISPQATLNLEISNEGYIYFDTRFSGVAHSVVIDTNVILGICARENQEGQLFETSAPKPAPNAEQDNNRFVLHEHTAENKPSSSSPFKIVK